MAAPDFATLLNFEGQLVHAARSILVAGGFTVRERGNRAALSDTFTAVMVDVGDATGRLGRRPEGTTEHAQYLATLSVTVAIERKTNEPEGDATGTLLDQRCAAIRALFLNHPNPFAAYQDAAGVYLQVHGIRPLAAQSDLDTGPEVDSRVLSWELSFIIPDSAWPSVA